MFPALAIADALREKLPNALIHFVGAKGKLEMEKVPQAGYPITGLWISGFDRRRMWRNVLFPVKLISSLWKSYRLVRQFRPAVAIGVGGYASGPLLAVANRLRIPTLVQEQNAFPGVTNKLLARRVDTICVAYEGMARYFPADKLVLTGNPVRKAFLTQPFERSEALAHFGLQPDRKTLFVFGGSLGARRLNESIAAQMEQLRKRQDVQLLWQVGKLYHDEYQQHAIHQLPNVRLSPFVDRMDLAYGLADLVVCRAGALTLSELSLLGKPALLVPSPNVAEDHQTKNARALVEAGAAEMISDAEAPEQLLPRALTLIQQTERLATMGQKIKEKARPEAAGHIANEVLALLPK